MACCLGCSPRPGRRHRRRGEDYRAAGTSGRLSPSLLLLLAATALLVGLDGAARAHRRRRGALWLAGAGAGGRRRPLAGPRRDGRAANGGFAAGAAGSPAGHAPAATHLLGLLAALATVAATYLLAGELLRRPRRSAAGWRCWQEAGLAGGTLPLLHFGRLAAWLPATAAGTLAAALLLAGQRAPPQGVSGGQRHPDGPRRSGLTAAGWCLWSCCCSGGPASGGRAGGQASRAIACRRQGAT